MRMRAVAAEKLADSIIRVRVGQLLIKRQPQLQQFPFLKCQFLWFSCIFHLGHGATAGDEVNEHGIQGFNADDKIYIGFILPLVG